MDVPAGVTQEEGHKGFLIHLPSAVRAVIFLARRIQPFLSLVDRELEFCVLKADSYGNEKLKREWSKPVCLFFTKNMVRANLMATVLFWHGFENKSTLVYAG